MVYLPNAGPACFAFFLIAYVLTLDGAKEGKGLSAAGLQSSGDLKFIVSAMGQAFFAVIGCRYHVDLRLLY